MSVDLSVEIAGLRFRNPFILASAPTTCLRPGSVARAAEAGWGGVISKTYVVGGSARGFEGYVGRGWLPREVPFVERASSFYAMQNSTWVLMTPGSEELPEEFHKAVGQAKAEAEGSGMPVGISIIGWKGYSEGGAEEWVKMARAAEEGGADFIQLNMGVSYVPGVGIDIFRNAAKAREVVKAVKGVVRVPVEAKLSAAMMRDDLVAAARAAEEAGADIISATNTVPGIIGVDIERALPIAHFIDKNGKLAASVGGISGPAIKPMALRSTWDLVRSVKTPVSAIGGVSNWESAVEFIMMGASTVQVGTAAMFFGHRMVKSMTRGLQGFMTRKGYRRVQELRGAATTRMAEVYAVADRVQPLRIQIDEGRCNGCEKCVVACEATSQGAMQMHGHVARVDHDICLQCYMCIMVCPKQAVSRGEFQI